MKNRIYKLIILIFTLIFSLMTSIDLFVQGTDIAFKQNLFISLFVTGIFCLYGGILNLVNRKQRHL